MICGIIVPRQEDILGFREDNYLAECVRPRHHREPHLFKTPEGRFFAWKDDWDCGCCEPEDDERCYIFWEVDGGELKSLLKEQVD